MKQYFKIEIDKDRIFGLDLLRAFAILGVVAIHGNDLLPVRWSNCLTKYMFFDWVGIFFVLSGFLVGGIFIRNGEQKGLNKNMILDFWRRRWWRTLPAYFLVLAILVTLHVIYNPAFSVKSVWQYPFFLQNFASPIPAFFVESWSLCVEEWFYFIIPVAIVILVKTGILSFKQAVLIIALAIIIFSTCIRFYRYYVYSPNSDLLVYFANVRLQVITRLDGIMFGVLGAFWNYYYKATFVAYKNKLAFVSIAIWLFTGYSRRFYPENTEMYLDSIYWWVMDFTMVSIASLFLLPYLTEWKKAKGYLYKFITTVSLISYSMYLLNQGVIYEIVINRLIPWGEILENDLLMAISKYLLYWILVFVFSFLLYKYFELPMMRLRDNKKIKALLKTS